MQRPSTKLRALLREKTFLHLPSVYDAIGGRLVQSLGYEATYVGGYVSGASTAVTVIPALMPSFTARGFPEYPAVALSPVRPAGRPG